VRDGLVALERRRGPVHFAVRHVHALGAHVDPRAALDPRRRAGLRAGGDGRPGAILDHQLTRHVGSGRHGRRHDHAQRNGDDGRQDAKISRFSHDSRNARWYSRQEFKTPPRERSIGER
jgi:hypothetical protein